MKMNMPFLLLLFAGSITLTACNAEEPNTATEKPNQKLELIEWNSVPVKNVSATLFPNDIKGRAHCNNFSAKIDTQDGIVSIGPIMCTRAACHKLNEEQTFLIGLIRSTKLNERTMAPFLCHRTAIRFYLRHDRAIVPFRAPCCAWSS
jgi:heat shock protein HslJ